MDILFLSKLAPLFVYPLGLALVLILVGFLFFSFHRFARLVLVLAILLLWIASLPAAANYLYARLESSYPAVPIISLPIADVAIVLGGAVGEPLPPRVYADLSDASDRILEAARVYRAGKARWILVAAGNLPWLPKTKPEADVIAELLVEFGVPREAIVLERQSRNTRENAMNSLPLFEEHGWHSALLITSAAHMPRAMAVFQKIGFAVTAATADIRVTYPLYNSVLDFLPQADALSRTTDAIKELIGLAAYRMRGWA